MTDVQEKIEINIAYETFLNRIGRIYLRPDAYGFLLARPELLEAVEGFAEKAFPWNGDRALFVGLDEIQAKYYVSGKSDVMLFGASIGYGIEQEQHEVRAMRVSKLTQGGLRVDRDGDISMNT